MIDVIFIVATIAFFALMVAYVRGCRARSGRDRSNERRGSAMSIDLIVGGSSPWRSPSTCSTPCCAPRSSDRARRDPLA